MISGSPGITIPAPFSMMNGSEFPIRSRSAETSARVLLVTSTTGTPRARKCARLGSAGA